LKKPPASNSKAALRCFGKCRKKTRIFFRRMGIIRVNEKEKIKLAENIALEKLKDS
tara:strand:- start:27 stop:194 length:168 start_codon:yes stop_codon:yes gene_type:complete